MHFRNALPSLIVAFMVCGACTEVRIVEDSKQACSNGYDDDGNGRSDCEDPSCINSGACEITLEHCRNGLDDDGDGKTDCEDARCIELNHCEPFDQPCSLLPDVDCPRGMACYPKRNEFVGSSCRRPGIKSFGESCTRPDECIAGTGCAGACLAHCRTDDECGRGSFCAKLGAVAFGLCFLPCFPVVGNSGCGDYACFTTHSFEIGFAVTKSIAICNNPPPWQGLATVGMECEDPPSRTRLGKMCQSNLACAPIEGVPRCVETCALTTDGTNGIACPDVNTRCVPAYPDDMRDFRFTKFIQGICPPK